MTRTDAAWLAFWVGFGLVDYAADRRGHSLCTSARRVLHTDTPAGRVVFTVGLVVLRRHVLKP